MSDLTTLPYIKELAGLAETWKSALAATERMTDCLAEASRGSTAYVASGGGLAAAQIAADLHVQRLFSPAVAISPLELSNFGPGSIDSCVIFTARARHFDSAFAAAEAVRIRVKNLWVITLLEEKDVPEELRAYASIVSLSNNGLKDGFLATNSILSFCASLGAAHEQFEGRRLPETLPAFNDELELRVPRKHIVSLYAPPSFGAALDFETRMFETGMAWVQTTDARNFAHGRHFGLVENMKKTSVVTFEQPETVSFIEAICAEFPDETDLIRISTPEYGLAGMFDLLVRSMKLTALVACDRDVNVSEPDVSDFGKRLYHLPAKSLMLHKPMTPLSLKLQTVGLGNTHQADPIREFYESSYKEWIQNLTMQQFKGLVLDHDGTIVSTVGRDHLPPEPVRGQILALLEAGIPVAVATGRGRSIFDLLRGWVPESLQSNVFIGAYSGATWIALDSQDPIQPAGQDPDLQAAYNTLIGSPLRLFAGIELRPLQLTITPHVKYMNARSLLTPVQELLHNTHEGRIHIHLSGHSIDIIPAICSKASTVRQLRKHTGAEVLVIGDQGQAPGNDFEMLAETQFSLSVDSVSSAPDRCWHLAPCSDRGPMLLKRYLDRFKIKHDYFTVEVTPNE